MEPPSHGPLVRPRNRVSYSSAAALALIFSLVVGLAPAWGRGTGRDPRNPRSMSRSFPGAETPGLLMGRSVARTDTIDFGFYNPQTGFAVPGEMWTFDHGSADPFEGWTPAGPNLHHEWWRQISASSWAGHDNAVSVPVIVGQGSAWVGVFEDTADSLCYEAGLGYANEWGQRLVGPELTYTGSGSVNLSLRYFCDSEASYDYVRVVLAFGPGPRDNVVLNGDGFTGRIGNPGTGSYPTYTRTISQSVFGSHDRFRLIFEFDSDGGWSDEDGGYATNYGPCSFDDVSLSGSIGEGNQLYTFETGLDGFVPVDVGVWSAEAGIADASDYPLPDTVACGPSGRLLEFHDASGHHPEGQIDLIVSPIVDRGALGPVYDQVIAEYDIYALLYVDSMVYFRTGWSYYPYICPSSGLPTWSPIAFPDRVSVLDAGCMHQRELASSSGAPDGAQYYRLAIQVFKDYCDFLPCDDPDNFTPLVDNIRVRATQGPPSGVEEVPGEEVSGSGASSVSALFQNRPNPFHERTSIRFSLARSGPADVMIFDAAGRCVRTLVRETLSSGLHELVWDGLDDLGRPAGAGIYWSRLRAGGSVSSKKMLVVQ